MIALIANKRTEDVRQVRKQGFVPGVVYGQGMKSLSISVDYKLFKKVYSEAGENAVIELEIDGKKYNVLVKEVQLDPVRDTFLHVDFYQINMKEKTVVSIPLVLEGEVALVKSGEAILNKSMDEVEVECLPGDMPSEIKVDLSVLKTLDDSIYVKDLKVSDNVTILSEPEESIVSLSEPRAEEVETPVEAPAEADAEGKKKEAEGAAPSEEAEK